MNLYGASGHCKVIIDIIESNGGNITAIYDDNKKINKLLDYDVNSLTGKLDGTFIITIGNNQIRKKTVDKLDCDFVNAIHPKAILSKHSRLGQGTVVMAGAIISSDVRIGNHVIINHNATVDHDCVLCDFVHISPNAGLSGNVEVLEGAHIGIGSQIIQGVKIGKWSTIGAGAIVIEDVPDFAVVVGNPAKIIRFNK
jgi:acetyltransferase EpsM